MAADEDALICDFAETYYIHDYRALPVEYAATLASGLRAGSRIIGVLSGTEITTADALLAQIVDNTRWLIWAQTEDGAKGRNHPQSVLAELTGHREEKRGYCSASEYEEARRRILGKA